MIYIKRLLWLIGLFPVAVLTVAVIVLEFLTLPLKLVIGFMKCGSMEMCKMAWLKFIFCHLVNYINMDIKDEEE